MKIKTYDIRLLCIFPYLTETSNQLYLVFSFSAKETIGLPCGKSKELD